MTRTDRPTPEHDRSPMATRAAVLALAILAAASLGPSCGGGGSPLVIVSPAGVVSTFAFPVEIHVDATRLDPTSLEVTLNGEDLVVAETAPGVFTATVEAGDPLRDANLLLADADRQNGNGSVLAKSAFLYLPPKARARKILLPLGLPSGPLAHARIGDFLLANTEARFVVQGPNRRDLHSIGQYGGNLIDAELKDRPGQETFFEMTASVNIESVINADSVVVLNDGENGLPAVLRACGPDDLLDYINPSSLVAELGGSFPPAADDPDLAVEGCTDYTLEPGASDVRIETTYFNNDAAAVGLYVGDYVNGMGPLEQWTREVPTFVGDFDAGLGEILALPGIDLLSFFGFGGNTGVSYFRVGEPFTGATEPDSSFTQTGVSFVMANNSVPLVLFFGNPPSFSVPGNGQKAFARRFGVGPGSGADAIPLVLDLPPATAPAEVSGCVTVGGSPAPDARVSAGVGSAIDSLEATWVTGDDGCFAGELAPGTYSFAAAREGTPYEGGGSSPVLQTATLASGANPALAFALPATGRVSVEVVDEIGQPMPARVAVVGFDPSPEPTILFNFFNLLVSNGGVFNDITRDTLPFGITAVAYADAAGEAAFDLEPGSYEIFVSRGTEYSIHREPLTVTAGATESVSAQIARVLDTTGFVSSDYHVHLVNSPDSRVAKVLRVMQFAGEGIDNLIATDHDARTKLGPTIAALGLGDWLHSTVGEETTTFDYGHFNSYPLGVDPLRPSGGSVDWARAAPVGEDFPSLGAYGLSPAEIASEVQTQTGSFGNPLNTSPEVATQINHIDSHFSPLRIDTSQEPPQSFLPDPSVFRLDPSVANFFHHFPALELWNGASRGDQEDFRFERIGIWFNHLNQGLRTTFIADTDTHTYLNLRTAGARTWTPSSTDEPAWIDDDEIGAAVKAGRAVGGQGVYVQTRLREADTPANVADFSLYGSTDLDTAGDPDVELVIDVQTPAWVEFDTVEIYANAPTEVTGSVGGTPVLFGAVPERVFCLSLAQDPACTDVFALPAPVVVHPGVPGAERRELELVVPFTLAQDTWFVAVVRGTDGVSEPMFPVFAQDLAHDPGAVPPVNADLAGLLDGNLDEGGVLALGATNALYANVDGDADFDPPGVQLAAP